MHFLVKVVMHFLEKYSLLKKIKLNSDILRKELSEIFLNYRSAGHLIAFDFDSKELRDDFASKAYDKKILVNPTSEKTIRFRPNLAFSEDELDDLLFRIKKII